jgi:hypothetical protein
MDHRFDELNAGRRDWTIMVTWLTRPPRRASPWPLKARIVDIANDQRRLTFEQHPIADIALHAWGDCGSDGQSARASRPILGAPPADQESAALCISIFLIDDDFGSQTVAEKILPKREEKYYPTPRLIGRDPHCPFREMGDSLPFPRDG